MGKKKSSKKPKTSTLADVLGPYVARSYSSVNRLARLSGVPKRTIANWLDGRIEKPRHWQALIKLAAALYLSQIEADQLLTAAGHPPVAELFRLAAGSERALFKPFQPLIFTAPFVAPFQVIVDLPTFVGRDSELIQLKEALLAGQHVGIFSLHGMGGVGKTALAVRLAYELRDHFPDGVLWARLDTSDTLTILSQFADAYGKDVHAYHDVESRGAIVRNLLNEKQALIVLDNAETSAQVRPLLPPSTSRCAVLITARNAELTVMDGWKRLALEPFAMDSGDALRLFKKFLDVEYVARNRAALAQIAELLGHLPLALAIIAGRMRTDSPPLPKLIGTLQRSEARLRVLKRDDYNVQLSFDVSFDALSSELQSFFAMLGVFGGEDFEATAVAHVTATTREAAETNLRRLRTRSLAQESRAGRWRLHPLLRDYARQKLREAKADEPAFNRMVEFYIEAVERVGKSGYKPLAAELDNIVFALETAQTRGLNSALLRGALLSFQMLDTLGLYSPVDRFAQPALEGAHQLEDGARLAKLLFVLTQIESLSRMRYEDAQRYGKQALAITREIGDWDLAGETLVLLAGVAWSKGQAEQEAAYFAEAETLAREHGAGWALARLNRERGFRALWRGELEYAEASERAFLEFVRRRNDAEWIWKALDELAYVLLRQERYAEAEACYTESISIAEQAHGFKPVMPVFGLGLNALEWGRLDQADEYMHAAVELARSNGKPRDLLNTLIYAGDVALARHEFERAADLWAESRTLVERLGEEKKLCVIVMRLGELALAQNQLERAEALLNQSLKMALPFGDASLFGVAHRHLARLAAARGEMEKARQHAGESLKHFEAMKLKKWADEMRAWLAGLEKMDDSQ